MWYQGEVNSQGKYDGLGISVRNTRMEVAYWKDGKRHGRFMEIHSQGLKVEGEDRLGVQVG